MVFSICRLVTMSRNLVQILIKDSGFCLIQTLNVYFCPAQCIHPCHTAAILDILGMKSRRCVANLRFAAINHAKQRFQCALMCPCAQITDQKVN